MDTSKIDMNQDGDVVRGMKELSKYPVRRKPDTPVRHGGPNSPFMSLDQVIGKIPLSKSTIYLMISRGEFPAQIKLGGRAAVWSKAEIDDWISARINRESLK